MNELTQIASANIYLVIDRSENYQIYKLINQPDWSSSKQEMIRRSNLMILTFIDTMTLL